MKHMHPIHSQTAVRQGSALFNVPKSMLLALALLCGLTASAQTVTSNYTITVNGAIPDASASGRASVTNISSRITSITDVNVTLKINGTYNGDLYAYLTHSSGRTILLNRVGKRASSTLGYGDDGLNVAFDDAEATHANDVHLYRMDLTGNNSTPISGQLTGTWRPDGRTNSPLTVLDTDSRTALLNSFNGLNANGEWVLFVADLESGDITPWIIGDSKSAVTPRPSLHRTPPVKPRNVPLKLQVSA